MLAICKLPENVRQYGIITGNYWAFTLTDGALRMLVLLHFYERGFSPVALATLFVFYELTGIITNLAGGWIGARWGLNKTMNSGLLLQIIALSLLLVPDSLLSIPWIMTAQALSGIAKDLNKMSAKSSLKILIPITASSDAETNSICPSKIHTSKTKSPKANSQTTLYRWVTLLTGSKNALKGIGFFLGGTLLSLLGFQGAILVMLIALLGVLILSLVFLKKDLGKTSFKPKFSDSFSKNPAVNYLSAARLFLFAARDVWFVVALPVYLATTLTWSHSAVGTFLALWIIGYGLVQTCAPTITHALSGQSPTGKHAQFWSLPLLAITIAIALSLSYAWHKEFILLLGLFIFGMFFAINSSIHSYLIVTYARRDGASLDVGFYYMANAMGRLTGTLLSGWIFQQYGLAMCLWIAAGFIALSALISTGLHNSS